MKIEGAKVFVTGGNRGIGLAMAKAFSAAGAHVWIGVRNPNSPAVADALREINELSPSVSSQAPSGRALTLDLSSRESIERSLPDILKCEIDILVNNAGQLTGGLLEEQPLDEIYEMYQVNTIAVAHISRALLRGMIARKRGKIVNNASVAGVMNVPLASTYGSAKAAVIALTASLAIELRGTGVSTLTLVTPGVKTRMFDEIKVKYGPKIDLAAIEGAMEPDDWALEVVAAIANDRDVLLPGGTSRAGLLFAKFLPALFGRVVGTQFRRNGIN